jgi:hypothetical protein
MEFSSWLAIQRGTLPQLHVDGGEYVARWWPRRRLYTAAPCLPGTAHEGRIVLVEALSYAGGSVRAAVRLEACEYVFEPVWIHGAGLGAHRVSPVAHGRQGPLATEIRGCAAAALRCAAERSYGRLRDLALDIAGRRWPEALERLTRGDLGPFRDAGLAVLREAPLAELKIVRVDGRCVGCGRRFQRGEVGPVFELWSCLALCRACHGATERPRAAPTHHHERNPA